MPVASFVATMSDPHQPSHDGGPASRTRLPAAGSLVAKRYRVTEGLGRGGMCAVLAARDETLERDVALKLVLPHLMVSEQIGQRFVNEARSLARMDSPHVVRVLDFGVVLEPECSAGLPFMVLELLRGKDLFAYAAEHGSLTAERVVRFALEACDGLAAAHAEGIIHRDLKPENLFVAIDPDGNECLKVLDFGIARGRGGRVLTLDQVSVGSPGYMSPEQVSRSSQVDARSDIWSLGIVMYELLANRPAFKGDSPQELCLQIVNTRLTPLSELRPDLPPSLVYVVDRCLEREVERRFQDVGELAEALAPLDDWSPMNEAKRIRRRLDVRSGFQVPIDQRKVLQAAAVESQPSSSRRPSKRPVPVASRRRRVLSAAFVALALVPVFAILPTLLRAPELATARAWSSHAVNATQGALSRARHAAVQLWSEASDDDSSATPASR